MILAKISFYNDELMQIVRQESDSTRDEALRMKTLQKLSELTISQCSPSLSSLLTSSNCHSFMLLQVI